MFMLPSICVRQAPRRVGVKTYLSTRAFASGLDKAGNLADVCELNIVKSPFPPIEQSSHSAVPEFVSSSWNGPTLAQKIAIRDGSTGETRTFSQYHTSMTNVASALHYEYLLQPDDSVALFSPNNVDYLPICLAVGMCGSKVAPINPLSTADELSKILERSFSKILFTHAKLLHVALEAVSKCDGVVEDVVVRELIEFSTFSIIFKVKVKLETCRLFEDINIKNILHLIIMKEFLINILKLSV